MKKKNRKELPSISVIVITRETPLLILKRCIQCLRTQTLKKIQIILLDANEKDSPYQHAIASEADFFQDIIKVDYPETGEMVHGKNLALTKATADYITFIYAQDIMPETRLETILQTFKKNTRYCVYYTSMTFQENNSLETSDYTLESGTYHSLAQAVFHRSVFQLVGTFDENMIALWDEEFWMRIQFYDLAGFITDNEAVISICKEDQETISPRNAAIAYQQILVKYRKIFKKSKRNKRKIYLKIAENYKKDHVLLRYLQFQWKGMFCK